MTIDRIKTQWASVRLTSDRRLILCVNHADSSVCIYFESPEQFKAASNAKKICVRNWVVSIPDSCTITKSALLPASDLSEAYRMLEFEMPSWLPLPPEELVYGCRAVERKGDLLGVQVLIVKADVLAGLLADYEAVGIRPSKVLVDSVAAGRWFNMHSGAIRSGVDLLLDGRRCLVLAGLDGKPRAHSEVMLEGNDISESRQRIAEEVGVLADENAAGDASGALRIASERAVWPDTHEWFGRRFESIELVDLPELCPYDGDGSPPPPAQCLYDAAIAQGSMLALQDPDLAFLNLLPGRLVKQAEKKQLITNCAVTVAMCLSLIFLLWLSFAAMNWRTEWACGRIGKKIAPIEDIAATVESKRQRVKAIQNQLSNRDQVGRVFEHLSRYTPPEISISQFSYTSKPDSTTINMRGQAGTLSGALEYSFAMQESDLLRDIQVTNAQQVAAPGGSVVEFRADCVLNKR
jgi:hypothetical protein